MRAPAAIETVTRNRSMGGRGLTGVETQGTVKRDTGRNIGSSDFLRVWRIRGKN
jgi:hypothetical protein